MTIVLISFTDGDSYPSQGEVRICSLQKVLKEKATTHVVAQYKLQGGCKTLVTALLAGRSYIFPGDVMNVDMSSDAVWSGNNHTNTNI